LRTSTPHGGWRGKAGWLSGVVLAVAACGPRDATGSEGGRRDAVSPAKEPTQREGEAKKSGEHERPPRRQRGFAVVAGDAIPYEDADGTPLPWPSFEAEHDLGGRVPGYVVRRLESQGARVRVETISSEATPTDGCGVGIVGLDPFALQFWVDDDALLEVVTDRKSVS